MELRETMKIATIGECMIELARDRDGRLMQGYGGDTLNTAVYLARLGAKVDYVTALGDDPYSEGMIQAWQAEGVGTDLVIRAPGRLLGLYVIETDARGERRFFTGGTAHRRGSSLNYRRVHGSLMSCWTMTCSTSRG